MGFAIIFVGVLLAISAVRGTTPQLAALVKSDFTGQGSYLWWLVAVLIIGSVGYIPPLRTLSRAMLVLVVIALIINKGNPLFSQGGLLASLSSQLTGSTSQS